MLPNPTQLSTSKKIMVIICYRKGAGELRSVERGRGWKSAFCHGADPSVYSSFPSCPCATILISCSATNPGINGCISVSSSAPFTELPTWKC